MPPLGVDRRHPGVDERAGEGRGEREEAEQKEPPTEVRRSPDGDQTLQVVVEPGVPVAEYPAHGVAHVEDAPPPRPRLHRRHRRRDVVQQVVVQVPAVVEVRWERAPGRFRALALELRVALAVASQLDDVDVEPEVEEVLTNSPLVQVWRFWEKPCTRRRGSPSSGWWNGCGPARSG